MMMIGAARRWAAAVVGEDHDRQQVQAERDRRRRRCADSLRDGAQRLPVRLEKSMESAMAGTSTIDVIAQFSLNRRTNCHANAVGGEARVLRSGADEKWCGRSECCGHR